MKDIDAFTHQFVRGLRSVPEYIGTICHHCTGSCGELPDDQCLISAWTSYIQGAHEHGYDAYETGRRCAMAQLQHREQHSEVRLPCEASAAT
jgi:hypothetical protein